MALLRTLTDRGSEYCGIAETHPYQLFLHLNDIEHTRTKARHPQTNGMTEKLNQTIQEDFYALAFSKRLYETMEDLRVDLDGFMQRYNTDRTNQRRHCKGRTPMETFLAGKELNQKFVYEEAEETEEMN